MPNLTDCRTSENPDGCPVSCPALVQVHTISQDGARIHRNVNGVTSATLSETERASNCGGRVKRQMSWPFPNGECCRRLQPRPRQGSWKVLFCYPVSSKRSGHQSWFCKSDRERLLAEPWTCGTFVPALALPGIGGA